MSPATDRVLEIAGIKVRAGVEIDRFSELLDPGQAVPGRITRLTGITSAMVFGKPSASEVLPRFLEFVDESILVAHNFPFDAGFLNAELTRAGLPVLSCPALCTLRMARRLLRGLPSKGLSGLIQFFGLTVENRHRALDDAEATKDILLRFLAQLADEYGITVVDELLRFQKRTYTTLNRPAKHIQHIRETVLPAVPERSGIYFMKGKQAELLYVGKAKDLRRRVRSYFSGIEGHPPRTRQLLRLVREVTWTVTDSELEALVLESQLIKEHQPRYNRAERRYHNRPFVRLGRIGSGTWITVITHIRDDGAQYYGPLPTRGQAEFVAKALVTLCGAGEDFTDHPSALRQRPPSRFGGRLAPDGIASARDFLQGRGQAVLLQMEARMRGAAAALEFEKAARYRNALQHMRDVARRGNVLAISVFDRNLAVVHRMDTCTQVHLVRFGRCVATVPVQVPPLPEDATRMHACVAAHFEQPPDGPDRFTLQEADEIRILAHWMYQERESLRTVEKAGSAADFARAILAAIDG